MNKIALIAAVAGALAAVPAQASSMITSIQVTNNDGIPGEGYLQIAELQLFGGSTNYALSGTATATSIYADGSNAAPDYANDGSLNGNYPNIYHGNDANGSDVFTLTLAAPTAIDRISIYGRTDCCGYRDLYSFTTFDGTTAVQSGTLDAREGGFATVGAVPEPATWAMMMLGFGMIGFGLRRRSKVTTSVRFA